MSAIAQLRSFGRMIDCAPARKKAMAAMSIQGRVYEPVEHVTVWVDGGIMLNTREPHGDPVEMSEDEAEGLANLLLELVKSERAGNAPTD